MNDQKESVLGPPPVTLPIFILRTFSALGGGILGSVIILGIFVLSSSILQPVFQAEVALGEIPPLFIFVFMAMMFLSSLGASLVANLLTILSDKKKYRKLASALYQIFIVNILIFIFMLPLYLLIARLDLTTLPYIAGLHLILSAQASVLVLEIVSNYKYSILGVYGVIFGSLIGLILIAISFKIIPNLVFVLLLTLPVLWLSIGLLMNIVNLFYQGLYNLYGVDFLSAETGYGGDKTDAPPASAPTQADIEEGKIAKKTATEENPDEKGEDFLDRKEN